MSSDKSGVVRISGLESQRGFLTLEGPVDATASTTLNSSIRMLIDDYKYRQIILKIDSPGGSIIELRKMMREIKAVKASGARVLVCSDSVAGSAAAVLFCLGSWGDRSVNPDTVLLFHFGRFLAPAGTALTADGAGIAKNQLKALDKWLLTEIFDELSIGAGSSKALFAELARRAGLILHEFDRLIAELCLLPPSADRQRADRATLKVLCELQLREENISTRKYFNLLKKEFERDNPINLAVAYAMGFIDSIDHTSLELTSQEDIDTTLRQRPLAQV